MVTVISSKAERKLAIEAIGATAAIGSMDDAIFLTKAFYRRRCGLLYAGSSC